MIDRPKLFLQGYAAFSFCAQPPIEMVSKPIYRRNLLHNMYYVASGLRSCPCPYFSREKNHETNIKYFFLSAQVISHPFEPAINVNT